MRTFGWLVTIAVGGYVAYITLKSLPDIARYAKISSM